VADNPTVSVIVPPKGTRGAPFPRIITRVLRNFAPRYFRRRPHTTAGGIPAFMLETRGARSGEPRSAILGFLEDGPSAWLVVASAIGAARHPSWLHNLARHPHATIEFFGGRRIEVDAETLSGDELDAAWKRLQTEAPEYPRYLSKTDRQIPIVRLTERPGTDSEPPTTP
jgi:deazaflavin-dependent oxidoreductase (nitroreductase family)